MNDKSNYESKNSSTLIFACSGAADVGEIADRAARKMAKKGSGKMFCLAGIGGRIEGIMNTTQAALKILAIDGCPLNCAKSSLEQAGYTELEHLQLAEIGMEKGNTPPTENNISTVAAKGAELLA